MRRHTPLAAIAVLAIAVGGCDQATPTVPDAVGPSLATVAPPAGVTDGPISGTISSLGNLPPGDLTVTPSGNCHFTNFDNQSEYSGDIEGIVTNERRIMNLRCAAPDRPGPLNFSGPVHGTVTYAGLTGEIEGQGHGHCAYDPESPAGYSCGGVYNARGSGELEGLHFRISWGPGWFPFSYRGTVSTH